MVMDASGGVLVYHDGAHGVTRPTLAIKYFTFALMSLD